MAARYVQVTNGDKPKTMPQAVAVVLREVGRPLHIVEIAEELRTSYELAYYPSRPIKDDTFRKIVIRPRLDNLVIRTKTGYFSR